MNKLESVATYLSPSESCCPKCGSRNIQSISRITGYLALEERFGGGKECELDGRVCHNTEKHEHIYRKD